MPLRNRVTPYGEIVAVPERGLLMGNRGILHDDAQRLVRAWQVRRWITCRLMFRGRHRQVMRPHSYTELFFLDEATAFAAGHRPCAECRHADYQRFQAAWAVGVGGLVSADDMDVVLHADRLEAVGRSGRTRGTSQRKRLYWEQVGVLPDGAFITLNGSAWLLWHDHLLEWTAAGYQNPRPLPPASSRVVVLTPPALVAVLRAGYPLQVHGTADGETT